MDIDLFTTAWLCGAGVAAGIIASIVGGAAVVTFPALIAAGVSPQMAIACNITALMPGILTAAYTDRGQLPKIDRSFAILSIASLTGAGLGAYALLISPERLFTGLIPLLMAFATVLFGFSRQISAWVRARAERRGHSIDLNVNSLKMLLPVSFYGGYFGAGAGILVLGIFSIVTGGDYRSANVIKNFVSGLNALAASSLFILQGAVVWQPTLALMSGTIVGGYIGAHIARILPREVVRVMIVVIGAVLTVAFARRYWF